MFDPRVTRLRRPAARTAAAAWRNGSGPCVLSRRALEELDRWRDHLERMESRSRRNSNGRAAAARIYFRDPAGNSLEIAEPRIWGLAGPSSLRGRSWWSRRTIPARLTRDQELLAAASASRSVSAAALGCPSRRKPAHLRGQCRAQGEAAAAASGLPALADDSGLASMRWAAIPAFIRRAGRGPQGFRAGHAQCRGEAASRRRAVRPEERRAAFRERALPSPGPTDMTETSRAASTERWSGRRAGQGIRLRSDVRARRSCADIRRNGPAGQACDLAPGARLSEARSMHSSEPGSASTSIGRSAGPNAPIAISTPMCATRQSTRWRSPPRWRRELTGSPSAPPGRDGDEHFLRRRHALADAACRGRHVLDAIAALWRVAPDAEVTLEANPTSVEAGNFARLSRGRSQSRFGRRAGARTMPTQGARAPAHGGRSLGGLPAGGADFPRGSRSISSMRGPARASAAWRDELAQALAEQQGHMSLYQLTIEPGTRFADLHRAGKLIRPDEDPRRALTRSRRS